MKTVTLTPPQVALVIRVAIVFHPPLPQMLNESRARLRRMATGRMRPSSAALEILQLTPEGDDYTCPAQ
jgi:hypothetical protein